LRINLVSIKELYYDARPTKSQEWLGCRVDKRWILFLYNERCCPLGYKLLSAGKLLPNSQRLNNSLKHR